MGRFVRLDRVGTLVAVLSAAACASTTFNSTWKASESLTSGGARKALYFKGGRVVFAASNLPSDRLGEVLLREGKITPEENETSVRALAQGRRQGRVLVEMGALSPDELWWAVQTQVREIVFNVFQWDEGQFHFEESSLPEKEKITVDLDVTALVLEGVRRMDPAGAVRARQPDGFLVLEKGETPAGSLLHPWEQHVLSLVNGERSVVELCHESEAGEGQTLKALYAFLCTGIVRARGRKVRALDQDFVPEDSALAVLDSFNRMYRHVLAYMVKEVGPIAENVLAKYLNTVRESRPEVLAAVVLRKDGSLDEAAIERNLARLPEERRRASLVDAQRAPLRGAARRQAHPGLRPRERHRPRPPPPAVSGPTTPLDGDRWWRL